MTDLLSDIDLQRLAERGVAELGPDASAWDLLRWTDENFAGNYVVASNMQDAVLVDMAAKIRPGVDILFLDTGYHFAETIGTRDAVESVYDVNVVNVAPERTVAEQDALLGANLFAREPNECCRLRKVEPLTKALAGYRAFAQGPVKINPIAAWSDDDMQAYIDANGVLVNPLVDEGYPSIGCAPCTAKPIAGADPRSGRWAGTGKIECGLHQS
ncbi:phosphoadenosine phosphosulfate reductase [Mycolicibacterium doricum]|uniref:Adenosine 5'-phosphosulfate reductase n=1 Tax=Mycolicibacterium doricum TaxID=126673 RepID=A0A7I7VTR3_9MYCO|nr:phosphoadenylyl-sulfate reductase [Mycolicibacterium doricum]BBZ08400.1 phosphoadenosine phosphosulfate reductase [Mycolicibacterium doricum]